MKTKQLLVNADDFGLTEGITDGIIEAHQRGIVTSTSIIAGGAAFEHAVTQLHRNQNLVVGVHLTLVEERPVSNPEDIPTLVQPNGRLPQNYKQLVSGLVFGRIRSQDVEQELRAQVAKCMKAGLNPTHLDSHQHVHALPSILRIVIQIAEEFQVTGIRLPRDSPRRHVAFWTDGFLQKTALCVMAHWDASSLRAPRFVVCDRMAGLFESGGLSESQLLAILEHLPDGTTELVCHPGIADMESQATYAHWHYNWEKELKTLTSQAVRDMVLKQHIELISYRDLHRSTKNSPSPISSAGPVR